MKRFLRLPVYLAQIFLAAIRMLPKSLYRKQQWRALWCFRLSSIQAPPMQDTVFVCIMYMGHDLHLCTLNWDSTPWKWTVCPNVGQLDCMMSALLFQWLLPSVLVCFMCYRGIVVSNSLFILSSFFFFFFLSSEFDASPRCKQSTISEQSPWRSPSSCREWWRRRADGLSSKLWHLQTEDQFTKYPVREPAAKREALVG